MGQGSSTCGTGTTIRTRGGSRRKTRSGSRGGLNAYGFASGDPKNNADPFGLWPWTDAIAQSLADWGARRGGVTGRIALNVGAALNGGFEASGINAAAEAGNKIGSGRALRGATEVAILIGGGKVAGAVASRAAAVLGRAGSAAIAGAEDVVTLYHQGNLSNGAVSATRSLSTSTSAELGHYAPGEALQTFKVPLKAFQAWDRAGYVSRFTDNYRGMVTPEIRVEAGAAGELNKYLVRP